MKPPNLNDPGGPSGTEAGSDRDGRAARDRAGEPARRTSGLVRLYQRLDASVRARILLPTGLLFAVTMATMALLAAYFHGTEVRRIDEERLVLVANAIKGEMVHEMLTYSREEGDRHSQVLEAFESAISTFGAQADSISIINPKGVVAFSSDPALVGSTFADPVRLPAESALIGEPRDGYFGIIQPVRNEKACARCHGDEHAVNGWISVQVSNQRSRGWLQASVIVLIAAPTLLALLAITWWLLGREVVRPLGRLTGAMARAEQGHVVVVPDTDRPDALGNAARSFDAALTALRRSQDEVEAFYRERMLRVDRFAAVGELATGLAHEIKNPLAGMLGALEILGEDLEGMQATIVGKLREEVLRLSSVLDSTLNFARSAKIHLRPVDVNELMNKLEFSLQPHLRRGAARIAIRKEFQDSLPRASADPTQLSQALLNIALNAVQSMEKTGGQLTLRTLAEETRIRIEIADTGPGIPDQIRPHIFEPFYTTKRQGTGIGLAHSARIIAEHDGDLDYECPDSGGTVFRVTLKRADQVASRQQTSPAPNQRDA